jgi:cell division protein FtsW (lipid II flippase)
MHQILLSLHSINRWLVLLSLLYSIYIAGRGRWQQRAFTAHDDMMRHVTATISQIQLLLGLSLYMISPIVKYAVAETQSNQLLSEHAFFKYIHIWLMAISVILITIGSAKAKRMPTDNEKFSTMLLWFVIALLIITAAIPWPFSPLANRPFIRSF